MPVSFLPDLDVLRRPVLDKTLVLLQLKVLITEVSAPDSLEVIAVKLTVTSVNSNRRHETDAHASHDRPLFSLRIEFLWEI